MYLRHGTTSTVAVLTVLGFAAGAYAYHLRPNSGLPQPGQPSIEVTFGPHYFATAPLQMTVELDTESSLPGINGTAVVMAIDLTGQDLTRPGWSVLAQVPGGVQPIGPNNNPREGRVTPIAGGGDYVYIAPGPQPRGTYSAVLIWNDLTSGPLQVRGANLVANFPDVTVENQSPGTSSNAASAPSPVVTLSHELQPPGSDYAYLGGLPPDREDRYTWSWNPVSGYQAGTIATFAALMIEARSASADEQSHSAEFQSGIFFGVAAASLIGALQEFLNAARKRKARRG